MAASVAFYAALQLRQVTAPPEAVRWGRLIASVVPVFPVATLTLLLGVMFVMSTKPDGPGSAITVIVAVLVGPLAAVRFWASLNRSPSRASELAVAGSTPTEAGSGDRG